MSSRDIPAKTVEKMAEMAGLLHSKQEDVTLQNTSLLTASIIGTPNAFSTAMKPFSLHRESNKLITGNEESYLTENPLPLADTR